MKRILILMALAIATPASACVGLFGPCADDELPLDQSTFQVYAKGGGWLTGPSPAPAVLQAASQGCLRRGFPQFVIAGAQNGETYNTFRAFNAFGSQYGVYGFSASPPPRRTTTAVIRCVRQGGIDARQYQSAND